VVRDYFHSLRTRGAVPANKEGRRCAIGVTFAPVEDRNAPDHMRDLTCPAINPDMKKK